LLEVDVLRADLVEQSRPLAEDDRRDVDLDLIFRCGSSLAMVSPSTVSQMASNSGSAAISALSSMATI
jgi:hypothetical protein